MSFSVARAQLLASAAPALGAASLTTLLLVLAFAALHALHEGAR
jgi:hypothetical protein